MRAFRRGSGREGVLLAVLALSMTAGCTPPLAALIVSPPNRINPLVNEGNPLPPLEALGTDQQFQVRVGPPWATLSVSVVEPQGTAGAAKGDILVLHGIYARSITMLHTARRLARAGYRAVLVDLRGHGRSTGQYLGYGVQEAKDLSQLLDLLEARGLATGPVGVYGVSYGATTAIHLAAVDPRVQAVVAIEPFSVVRAEISHFGRVMVPGAAMVSHDTLHRSINKAGRAGGFDPDHSDAADAIQRTSAQVLIAHGTGDWVTPYWHSVLLHQSAPDHSELVLVPNRGHVALWADSGGKLAQRATQWFDRWLGAEVPQQP